MKPMKPFKKIRKLSGVEARRLSARPDVFALPVHTLVFQSLDHLLATIPDLTNKAGAIMPDTLLMRHGGDENFTAIPLDVWVTRLLPPSEGRSDADLENERQSRKDLMDSIVRGLIQAESVDEYIVWLDSYVTDSKTGKVNEAILIVHSDSHETERMGSLSYERTEEGFVFGDVEWMDTCDGKSRRFGNLRELKTPREEDR
jgi:hypothetical protein